MNTKYYKIDEKNIDLKKINLASEVIKNGGLVAMPTETVYGLAANGLDEEACNKIFVAKNRQADNPLILHISNKDDVFSIADIDKKNDIGKKIREELWPGPITLIYPKKNIVPNIVTAGSETVAIRMPNNKIALKLIELSECPIAAPSANISGRPSPTNAKDVLEDLDGKIDVILDGGSSSIGLESTVLDLSTTIPKILRPGFFTLEDLRKYIPNIEMDKGIIEDGIIPKSPGQKYKHYAPNAEVIVYYGNQSNVIDNINKKITENNFDNKKIGVLVYEEYEKYFYNFENCIVKNIGSTKSNYFMGEKLFAYLRELDRMSVDIILIQFKEDIDFSEAIYNRLKKSSSGNIHKV